MTGEYDPSLDDAPLASAGNEPDPWRDVPSGPPGGNEPDPWRDIPAGTPPTPEATPEPDPAADDAPLGSAVAATKPARPALDPTSQLIVGAGVSVAVLALIGWVLGAWPFDWSGLILVVAGLVAAVAQYLTATGSANRSTPVPHRDLVLAGGTVAGILGVLFLIEIPFGLGNLDVYGGGLGAIVTVLLGVAGAALYVGATRLWTGGLGAPWKAGLASGDQATSLILVGAGLVVLGWLADVVFGVWYLKAGSAVVTVVVLAALLARSAADPDEPMHSPVPVGYIELPLTLLGAIIALQHTGQMFGTTARTTYIQWIPQLIYVVGVIVALAGAGLAAAAAARPVASGAAVPATAAPEIPAAPWVPVESAAPVTDPSEPAAPVTAPAPSDPADPTAPTDPPTQA